MRKSKFSEEQIIGFLKQADPWSDYIPENKGKKNEPVMAKK